MSNFIWVSEINNRAYKKDYAQVLDPGYHQPFSGKNLYNLNPYCSTVIWDGIQDGTFFQNGDIVQFYDNLEGRINTNKFYKIDVLNNFELDSNIPGDALIIKDCIDLPQKPSNLQITNITTTGFKLNWNSVEGALSYRLDVSLVQSFFEFIPEYQNLIVNDTNHSITGLIPGKIYYARTRAVNANGSGPNSFTIDQCTVPPKPAEPTISYSSPSTIISWLPVTGVSNYSIDIATGINFNGAFVDGYEDKSIVGSSTFNVILEEGTTYYTRVRAINDRTTNRVISENSPTASFSTPTP
jgi:hypothetical protein